MAPKRTVHELCPHCGEQQAYIRPDDSIVLSHHCGQQPPGPPNPPKSFRPDEVIFVPMKPYPGENLVRSTPVPRELTTHRLPGLNDALTIEVLDEPGPGGACHRYVVKGGDERKMSIADFVHCDIRFQKGSIQEAGVNGVSNEALLAIVIDRLRGFQSGNFHCHENDVALTHLMEALMWLQKRTRDRIERGVEGTFKA